MDPDPLAIAAPKRKPNQTLTIEADLVVIGGGIAGSAAAVAASRLGLKAALVQNRPVLGGNASSEVGLLMGGADRDFHHTRETGIVEEIDLVNRYYNHEIQWRNSISDATLENLVLDAGVDLYLNTHVHAIEKDANRIVAITASQQATEHVYRFESPLFVDATGDGCIAAMAGAAFMAGTEARSEFDESLAPDEPSPISMGSTLMYRVKDMGQPIPFRKPDWAYSFPNPEDLPVRIRHLDKPQLWIEYGAELNTIDDHVEIRQELLKILYGVWDHVKNHGDYGADNYVLSWVGAVPGKRESRRVIGDYILTQNDVVHPKPIPDGVAFGGWPIDVHNPKGFYAKKKWLDYTHLDKPYPIPLRCYYSRDMENLFLAGRIISATHIAHGSIRLMRTCGVGGQAVGTAAYICRKYQQTPRQVASQHITELQQLLLKHDAYIPAVTHDDRDDLARAPGVTVTASSEHTDPESGYVYAADKVITGISRGSGNDENLWLSQPMSSSRDQSTQFDPDPWIKLRWPEVIRLARVQVTFDTMVREQRFFDRPVLGPIPTCVKSYCLDLLDADDHWQTVYRESNNFQRHRVIEFTPRHVRAIRVNIEAVHDDLHARVYEIRAYGP